MSEGYASMEDATSSHSEGMDALLSLADQYVSQAPSDVLSFSNELAQVSARLSSVSAAKLQIEFENRDLLTRVVPLQMERKALVEENAFLKSQLTEFWTEIEKISAEKNLIFRERCEIVRKSVDEVTLVRSEMDQVKRQLELSVAEKDRALGSQLAIESEINSLRQNWKIREKVLVEKNQQTEQLVEILQKKIDANSNIEDEIEKVTSDLENGNIQIFDLQGKLDFQTAECENLKIEKEDLLKKIVHARDNKKANQFVSEILDKTKWTLSDLVDELRAAKQDVASKREQIDALQILVEEMKRKMPLVEANHTRLQQCELELQTVAEMNLKLKQGFVEREAQADKLLFEKARIETDYQSLRIRSGEFSKQIATLIHENELIRSKAGIHSGVSARSHPRMAALADDDEAMTLTDESKKRTRMSTSRDSFVSCGRPSLAPALCSFRTVLDLVEQNAELKERVDNLLNGCETEAQQQLVLLDEEKQQLEKANAELVAKRETDRIDSERILTRIEREHRSAIAEVDRLKKMMIGIAQPADDNLLLQTSREEWKKHVATLSDNHKTLVAVHSASLVEMEKLRTDLQKELDQRIYFEKMFTKMKHDVEGYYDKNKSLGSQIVALQNERDIALANFAQAQTRTSLLETEKRGFNGQTSGLKATIASLEASITALAREKESASALLVGYHQRLEQEAKIYQENSDMLKQLYLSETEKRGTTLSFYQTAYEEQVRRGNELSEQVARLTADLDRAVSSKTAEKQIVPESAFRLSQLEQDCLQLRQLLVATESLAQDYQTSVIPRLEKDVEMRDIDIANLKQAIETDRAKIAALELEIGQHSDQPMEDSSFLTRQLEEAQAELTSWERKHADLTELLSNLETEVSESRNKLKLSAEAAHQTLLVATVKETNLADQVTQLQTRLATIQSEHVQLVTQLDLAKAENEKYMAYLAADLGDVEKEEKGKAMIAQLQSSLSVHTARESQLVSDLQRVRVTMDTLLHENRALKCIVTERDELLATKEKLISDCRQFELRIASIDQLQEERSRLEEEVEKVKIEFANEHSARTRGEIEVRGLSEKTNLLMAENRALTERITTVSQQAEQWKEMHANLTGQIGTSDTDIAQLEKAKNQLSQTVSKLREEAAKKTAEIATISAELKESKSFVNLKEERIVVLEQEAAKAVMTVSGSDTTASTTNQIGQLMKLVVDYQSALTGMMGTPQDASML